MTTKVGFIGLGIMGSPMAVNLVEAGFEVTGYNRTPEKAEPLRAVGGTVADNVAQAVGDADVVATMLPDSPDVRAVVLGEDGVLAHAKPSTLLIDFSTIAPEAAADVSAAARGAGMGMLDAPVSGGEAGASEASLSIMVGGEEDDFRTAAPIFAALGTTIVHVGGAGAGQTVKAANQLIVAGNIELLAEAIVFLEAHDADLDAALTVLGGGLAGSTVLARKGASMVRRDFKPGFRVELHDKDLGIVAAAARTAGVAIPLGALVAQLVGALRAQGDGGLDHSALLKLATQLSGR